MRNTSSSTSSFFTIMCCPIMLCHTNSIYDIIAFFRVGIRRNFTQTIVVDDAAATALHLCVEDVGMNVLHKQHNLQRPDIGACCYQRHGDGNAEILLYSQITNKAIRVASGVSDLLYKVLRHYAILELFTEYLLGNFDDLGCMIIVLCEDQRFRDVFPFLFTVGVELLVYGLFICRIWTFYMPPTLF